jgi:two-component system chemotaxis response regulator CheY
MKIRHVPGKGVREMAYNILIVDDSLPMRALIKKIVKASGFDVGEFFEASNGREACQILDDAWLDLVLTDYNMPEMNGLELLDTMQQNENHKVTPVVMITTEGSQQRIEEFMARGAADYIKKPFTPGEIKQKLCAIMGETQNGQDDIDNSDESLDF